MPRVRKKKRREGDSIDFEAGLPRTDLSKAEPAENTIASKKPKKEKTKPADDDEDGEKSKRKTTKRDALDVTEFLSAATNVPSVLTWEAVRKKSIPDLGTSGLPSSLERDVPPSYRYWKCDTVDDALAVREELVDSELFTSKTIREINGELRRVIPEHVVKLYLPPVYDDSEPPAVPESRRSVEKVAMLLADDECPTTMFDEDVVETIGIVSIMERVRTIKGDWIVAAKDSPEARAAIDGPAFRLKSRTDLIFATSGALLDPESVEWVSGSRTENLVKYAFEEGREIKLIKATEERIVFGVVLEPDEVDSQNDTITAVEIEKACHHYMENFQNLGVQHKELANGRLKLLENFIAPIDFKIGKQAVKKGTWLMKERVADDELWKSVKAGEFTGFSIGGSAVRKPK